jgi:hypothetical protein
VCVDGKKVNKANGTECSDDGNACTADVCKDGQCDHPPDDSKIPPQNDPGDCKKEICQGGDIVSVEDTTEKAPVNDWAEEKFCALHPIACGYTLAVLVGQSFQWIDEMLEKYPKKFPEGSEHNGIADAARHAYWMCLTAEQFGVEFAEGLGNAHEEDSSYMPYYGDGGSYNPCDEKLMDLYNNEMGRHLAGEAGTCEEKVLNSVDQLRIIN